MTIAIQTQQISKKYQISHKASSNPTTLREAFGDSLRGLRKLFSNSSEDVESEEEFWALKDVSFDVQEGERIGVIGRNGAGKSTLLKILSMVVEPSSGRIRLLGRIASLLEVGTGFHAELTGRENIYLSGAILGMKRSEIARKFTDIVEFSGIENFLDTPVKHYSSGMYVRLGFAVAAHLDPDILIVDEVLAVGDAAFQKRCLGKMEEVAKSGRTILFVSHNMAAITTLCSRCLLLDGGRIQADGDSGEVVRKYLRISSPEKSRSLAERQDRNGTGEVRFMDCSAKIEREGNPVASFFCNDPVYFCLTLRASRPQQCWIGLTLRDPLGRKIMVSDTSFHGIDSLVITEETRIILHIPHLYLLEGSYVIDLGVYAPGSTAPLDFVLEAAEFEILPTDIYKVGRAYGSYQGVVHFPNEWLDAEYRPIKKNRSYV